MGTNSVTMSSSEERAAAGVERLIAGIREAADFAGDTVTISFEPLHDADVPPLYAHIHDLKALTARIEALQESERSQFDAKDRRIAELEAALRDVLSVVDAIRKQRQHYHGVTFEYYERQVAEVDDIAQKALGK
jgi:hypothetical protein